jgi:HEAT repeat protein
MEMEATEPIIPALEDEELSAEEMAAFARWVEELGIAHRAQAALRGLMDAGPRATPLVRQGLQHPNPDVRVGCCKVLDHFLDESALPELIENLAHPDEEVRSWALHALACDKCKEGVCRPGEADVIPIAVQMLLTDQSRRVRQMAAGLLGPSVHRRPDVLQALEQARQQDEHPVVRKIASWFTPGGPRYEQLRPKPARRTKVH